ncbi:MAG: hypothetical protein CLLPBCKN_006876 [Chroococcidiopsis cubana SAG 39.79]|uniref:Phage tail protein n=1 Tax=Chroococcidiopsis cubana SAG 39.79 TaxID=388085 RepID=A0AB37UIL3_9CYAN|nr:phage tail protein [Chroococcidiopsis cubana]MDZ4877441.1 hypothetical protein [Chroococcidiopsis cubana SAG 39.79]PSB65835.1 phage tail protein [Chroococcidiopsis cubana CCALA 043]RUT11221.1 hypothetical protein DSM107010_34900 [Chroococcidiopsis cubana SAG 39.79]
MVSDLTQYGEKNGGIRLELTPMMELPEAVAQTDLFLGELRQTATAQQKNQSFTLHPGEPTCVIVQIENWEVSSVQLIVWVKGNFPHNWCQLVPETPKQIANTRSSDDKAQPIDSKAIEIPAKGKWSGELLICIPDNFFEDWQAIESGNTKRLDINFQGNVSVYTRNSYNHQSGAAPFMAQVDFDLCVRPHSNKGYVGKLPQIYREQDFVNRFIGMLEQAFDPVVNSFNSMWANLDPLTCPQALLPFLAHWVAWPESADWRLNQQRRLIRRAVELYRWRGTRKGLRLYLHLYTGLPLDDDIPQEANKHISIIEPFSSGWVLGKSRLGVDTVLGGGKPYHFIVRLRCEDSSTIDEQLVRRIIDSEKPAFCTYELFLENLS